VKNEHWIAAPTPLEAALGGLLHDIGKLMQRAHAERRPPKPAIERAEDVLPTGKHGHTHWHALWTDAFFDWIEEERLPWPKTVDPRRVRDLAVFHHKPLQAAPGAPFAAATLLVTIADRVASGFERKPKDEAVESTSDPGAFRRTALRALTTSLRLAGKDQVSPRFFKPSPLSPEALTPSTPNAAAVEQGYAILWPLWLDGWRKIALGCHGDATAFEEAALNLSERLLWAVPSSTQDEPDVPLHDHARAVAAVAACLTSHHSTAGDLADPVAMRDATRPRLRFIIGDLSGLQATLFRLRSEGVSGLNRILRGRSMRFQLIAEAASRRAREAFGVPAACVLQSAGGRFLMLAPEFGAEETARRLDGLRADLDAWIAREYFGDLGIGLAASSPFATEDLTTAPHEQGRDGAFERGARVRDALQVAIEKAKLRQLEGPAAEALFDWPARSEPCGACGVRPGADADGRCVACAAEHAIGRALPRARSVVIGSAQATDRPFGVPVLLAFGDSGENGAQGWRLAPSGAGPVPLREGGAWVARHDGDATPYTGLEGVTELEAGDLKTLGMLARDGIAADGGQGREMLGVLKADVDLLGSLFATGFGPDFRLARQAALSRLMDAFFTLRLQDLLRREFPDSYTVYAGGDDLMIVAPWRNALSLAARLRADFAVFAGGNPSLALSASVALIDPRTPLSIAAHEAETRLSAAKDAGRDRVSAIEDEPLTWPAFDAALAASDRLNDWLRAGHIATGALYKFLWFDDARRRIATGDAQEADWAWKARLGYHLARMLPGRARDSVQAEIAGTMLGLFGLDERCGGGDDRPGARLALSAALYRNR
jgi:CRISPR-associated protein Csm1